MKTRRQIHVLALAAFALLALSCGGRASDDMKDGKAVPQPELNEVEVMVLERTDFAHQLLSNGKLVSSRKASLSFGTSGVVSALNVGNGASVRKGDVIAELDRSELRLSLESAQIAMQKAELDLYDVLAGQGYAAKDTLDVPADVLAMAKMRSGFSSARNSLERARREYEGAVLKAPFAGKIADVAAKRYETAPSGAFCTLIDDGSFDVDFPVLESEYAFISKGLPVKVSPYADPAKVLVGQVTEVNPVVDRNGQVYVTARVRNDGSLLDGMNVKVTVERLMPGQLVVPRSAVVIRDNLDVLFTYTPDGKAHWTYVNILMSNGDSHVVTANTDRAASLKEGDSVIISGNLNLADGSNVQLKK